MSDRANRTEAAAATEGRPMPKKMIKTDEEWKDILTPEQYDVLRRKGTESPGSGKYYRFKERGSYLCAACGNELFKSDTKYESGTGWPSFWTPASDDAIATAPDDSIPDRPRTEVLCARCGGHLGHVFEDGPEPSGLRYCINSIALEFWSAD